MHKKFNYDNPDGNHAWTSIITPYSYFIEIQVNEKSFKELVPFYRKEQNLGLQESFDFIKSKMGSVIVYRFSYINEWMNKLEELSRMFTCNVAFKAYCVDEFVGEKGRMIIGYA